MQPQSDWLVEQAIPEDAEALAFLHAESFKEAYLGDDAERNAQVLAEAADFVTPDRLQKRMELIVDSMEHSDKEFYAVVNNEDGVPAGFLYDYKEGEKQELHALYVSGEYFGSGVAQSLTSAFLDWCDPDKPVELGVVIDNERAQKFYKKIGFQATGEMHDSFYEYLPETKMVLPSRGVNMTEAEPQHTIEIVVPTLDDIPSYRAMQARSWNDVYPNDEAGVPREWVEERTAGWLTPEALAQSREFVANYLKDSARNFLFVAKEGEESVGMVHTTVLPSGQRLEALYVDKAYHGTGIGQKLLDEAMSHLDLTKPVDLEVAAYNGRAQAFYRKNGFEIVPDSEHLYKEIMPVLTMIRPGDTQ